MARKIADFATGKPVDISKPEEGIRQEYERILVESYGYPKSFMAIEVSIPRGVGYFPDRADIVIYQDGPGRDPAKDIIGIIETKKASEKGGIAQIKSYMTATSAIWGVWTNGENISYLYRDGTKIHDDYLNNIPAHGQSISDVGRLKKCDLKPFSTSELKAIFRRILATLYSNTSISRREKLGSEMMKIIFCKIKDEQTYLERTPSFRAESGEESKNVSKRIKGLFKQVCEDLKHDGIFRGTDTIELDDRSVAWVVGQLERGSLLTTDSDIVGDAFEVFSESKFIGEKGEFFTPRGIVRLAVKLANPSPGETVCDPACGSGGFLIHAMQHIWGVMESAPKWRGAKDISEQKRRMAAKTLFGIDKETDLVKIAKAHMTIAGDGRSNIVHENTLHDPSTFEGEAQQHFIKDDKFRKFNVVLANPPYGNKVKVLPEDSANFDLGHKWKKSADQWEKTDKVNSSDPYILFVDRCLGILKDGGRLAIVLPESAFHAPTLGYLRQFLLSKNNLMAIIDLPHNTFRPHCNAKTCLVVVEKGKPQQPTVIMGTPEEMGHNHQGHALMRRGTEELWDDLAESLGEIDNPDTPANKHIFSVAWKDVNPDILIPRFYRGLRKIKVGGGGEATNPTGIRLGDLVSNGVVKAWDGHGSPQSKEKGEGPIPYIRVSDIVNWELYRNPVTGIPRTIYEKMIKGKKKPHEGDIIFVRRGSYRIGTVAMASNRDHEVLLTKELLTLRVDENNEYGITPFYLLAMLSIQSVQNQINDLVFIDTTLPNMGDRWKYLVLPVHDDHKVISQISQQVEDSIRKKWSAQKRIDDLQDHLGERVIT